MAEAASAAATVSAAAFASTTVASAIAATAVISTVSATASTSALPTTAASTDATFAASAASSHYAAAAAMASSGIKQSGAFLDDNRLAIASLVIIMLLLFSLLIAGVLWLLTSATGFKRLDEESRTAAPTEPNSPPLPPKTPWKELLPSSGSPLRNVARDLSEENAIRARVLWT